MRGQTYENRLIYLTDLGRDSRPPMLEGYAFTGCQIRGPVIVRPMGGNSFHECRFWDSEAAMLYELPVGSVKTGLLGLANCTFTGCDFEGVGIAVTPDELEMVRRIVG